MTLNPMISPIPLPSLGVDMLSDETSLKAGTVRSAYNVDINRSGVFQRRAGQTLVESNSDLHTVASVQSRGWMLVGKGRAVFRVDPASNAGEFLADMGGPGSVDVQEINGSIYLINENSIQRVAPGAMAASPAGVPLPAAIPIPLPDPVGTFQPGRYAVAVSAVDAAGEESPLSAITSVTLHTTGGIRLSGMQPDPGRAYRVYVTPADGDELYLAETFTPTGFDHVVSSRPEGSIRATQHLAALPPGKWIRQHAGRLYTATEDRIVFSEAMRPHLTRPAHNFIKTVGLVRFFEPVAGGVFYGDDSGVTFLEGKDPVQFTQTKATPHRAIAGTSLTVSGAHLPGDMPAGDCAVWLSEAGYYVGLPTGQVVPLQAGRIAVAQHLAGRSAFIQRAGMKQIITLINTTTPQTIGIAIDSHAT